MFVSGAVDLIVAAHNLNFESNKLLCKTPDRILALSFQCGGLLVLPNPFGDAIMLRATPSSHLSALLRFKGLHFLE